MKSMAQVYRNEVEGEFVLSFGKYKGYTLDDVLYEDAQYLRWLFSATNFITRNHVSSKFVEKVQNAK